MEIILLTMAISFGVVVLLTPRLVKTLREKGRVAHDVHKYNSPIVAKGGGFVLIIGIACSILLTMGISTFLTREPVTPGLLAALVSVLMAGMIGILDDDLDLSIKAKIGLPLLASIPLMVMNVGTTTMAIPIIGIIDLGWLYPVIIVPLLVTFIIDSTNMYAGMNGLEAGLSTINSSAIILFLVLSTLVTGRALTRGQTDAAIVSGALFGISLAFYIFNRYPAKILPGDVGRLPMGAAMASALILGNMDRLAVFLYLPFFLNFILSIVYMFRARNSGKIYQKFAKPGEDGSLKVPGPFTIYWILPFFFERITEEKNVAILILFQAIIAYGSVLALLVAYPFSTGWI